MKKYISEDLKKIIKTTDDYNPYIIITMECNEQGDALNIESNINGNFLLLRGLLSYLEDIKDDLLNQISKETNDESFSIKDKVAQMTTILKQIAEINSQEAEALIKKYFPSGITTFSLNEADRFLKAAKDVLERLQKKDNDKTISLI